MESGGSDNVLERARAIQAVLAGDFSQCGQKIGFVTNDKQLYLGHVKEDLYESDEEESSSSFFKELLRASGGHDNDDPTGVSKNAFHNEDHDRPEDNAYYIEAGGKRIAFNDTEAFESELLPIGTPSAFGDVLRQETRVDKDVRVASEFTDFKWVNAQNEEVLPTSLWNVRQALFDVSSRIRSTNDVTVTPYKLNLYGKGGFFKKHMDHPRDAARTIATLVILLPTQYEGGALVVDTVRGDTVSMDSNSLVKEPNRLLACAFLTTCPHEVHEVTSGCRVSITYTVDLKDTASPSLPLSPLIVRQPVHVMKSKLAKAFEDYECGGIILCGLYTFEAVEKLGLTCLTHSNDIKLCKFLEKQIGVTNLRIVNVAYSFRSDDNSIFERGDDDKYSSTVYEVSLRRFNRLFRHDATRPTDEKDDFHVPLGEDVPFLYSYENCTGQKTKLNRKQAILYTGNESEAGELECIYFHTAVVFDVPQESRKRQHDSDDDDAPDSKKVKRDEDESEEEEEYYGSQDEDNE